MRQIPFHDSVRDTFVGIRFCQVCLKSRHNSGCTCLPLEFVSHFAPALSESCFCMKRCWLCFGCWQPLRYFSFCQDDLVYSRVAKYVRWFRCSCRYYCEMWCWTAVCCAHPESQTNSVSRYALCSRTSCLGLSNARDRSALHGICDSQTFLQLLIRTLYLSLLVHILLVPGFYHD